MVEGEVGQRLHQPHTSGLWGEGGGGGERGEESTTTVMAGHSCMPGRVHTGYM